MKLVFTVIAQYIVHVLKLWYHYASLGKLYKLNVWIVLKLLYLKVRVIFAMQPVHLYGKKIFFIITVQYVVHILKLQCHYTSLGKFYKLNVWIVPASLYLKVMATLALPCMCAVSFYEISKSSEISKIKLTSFI